MDATSQDHKRRLNNMVSRGEVMLYTATTKTGKTQVGLFADETRSEIEHAQEYGFASHPLSGAQSIAIFQGGNRDQGSVVKIFDPRYHKTDLEPGETAIYSSDGGEVRIKANGTILINTSTAVTITAPTVTIDGNLNVTGDITDNSEGAGISMEEMRSRYNTHTHGGSPTPTPTM